MDCRTIKSHIENYLKNGAAKVMNADAERSPKLSKVPGKDEKRRVLQVKRTTSISHKLFCRLFEFKKSTINGLESNIR